ncbi:MAG: hypothetical protein WBY67_24700 [Pseudolabrys sp.]
MRPTDTFKDAVMDQRLQDRLEVPGRQPITAKAFADTGRARALMATSMTAAMASRPLRDISGIGHDPR